MTELTRRAAVKLGAAAIFTLSAGGCTPAPLAWRERRDLFPQGVASGDPSSDGVVLWTRFPQEGGDARNLNVEVASDEAFEHVVARREVEVGPALDWTVRVLVDKLRPATVYWYRFSTPEGDGSRIGRTITAPADGDPRPVQFAFVSCQDTNQSALNAYKRMMYEDRRAPRSEQLGFVLHLGDYIYEVIMYPDETPTNYDRKVREVARYAPGEKYSKYHIPTTLGDYRAVWKGNLADPDLQDIRAWVPFVCIWDNHEFSWRGWQSFEVFGDAVKFTPSRKLAANQAWFEFQPARVGGGAVGGPNVFSAPAVADSDADEGSIAALVASADNAAATGSLNTTRALRYGANLDLFITDLFSHRDRPRGDMPEAAPFVIDGLSDFYPERVMEIIDAGAAYGNGAAPLTLEFGPVAAANFAKDLEPRSILGADQKRWLQEGLKASAAKWKIWGCSNGVLDMRADPQNLPSDFPHQWPKDGGYACFGDGDFSTARSERAEIYAFVRANGISNFAIVSGDRHSFWAGLAAAALPPKDFDPVGVAFITGSVSAPGLVEAFEHNYPKDSPLRGIYLTERAAGEKPDPTINLTLMHGLRSGLEYDRTKDIEKARSLSNAELAPHLSFVDMGGHGYSVVRVAPDSLETEFVCIPRPVTAAGEDGGPLRYRVRHRAAAWTVGDKPSLEQRFIEGEAPLSIRD